MNPFIDFKVIWLLDSSRMMLTVTKYRKKRYQRAQQAAQNETMEEEKKEK